MLSHDQIEAVLMRRAGYEVRVLPEEGASFEQNPPTLIEFIRRDLRWCQGNMQYWHFLAMPGLQAGQPLSARVRDPDVPRLAGLDRHAADRQRRRSRLAPTWSDFIRGDAGLALFVAVLVMWFAPKIATVIDVLIAARAAAHVRRRRALHGRA